MNFHEFDVHFLLSCKNITYHDLLSSVISKDITSWMLCNSFSALELNSPLMCWTDRNITKTVCASYIFQTIISVTVH